MMFRHLITFINVGKLIRMQSRLNVTRVNKPQVEKPRKIKLKVKDLKKQISHYE